MSDQAVAAAPGRSPAPGWRRWLTPERRRWLGPALAVVFLTLVAWLIADHAKEIDWSEVRAAVSAYPLSTLALAAALVAASHFTYACYDLLGRRYTGHRLPRRTVLGVGFVSYAFNLNLGALVGGLGFRLRLYSKLGLEPEQVGRIIAFSWVTNWSGWLLLAGSAFAARLVKLPSGFPLGTTAMQAIGFVLLALPLGYIAQCFFSTRREWRWRRRKFTLPSGRLSLAQIAMSSLNWTLICTIVWLLLPKELSYGTVLATTLSAAVVGVVVPVPGGLGTLEAVFIAALGGQVGQARLIAALLAYRALYYLSPLLVAATLHFTLERIAKRRALRAPPQH